MSGSELKAVRFNLRFWAMQRAIHNLFLTLMYWIVVQLVGSLHGVAHCQGISFYTQVDHTKNCVYRVETADHRFLGTAFCINKYGYLLTCAHVVTSGISTLDSVYLVNVVEGLIVTESDTSETTSVERLTAVVDTTIPRLDLAVLRVNPEQYGILRFEFLGFGNSDNLREGQDIAICAFIPDDFKLPKAFISRGIVSTIRPKTFDPRLNSEVDIIQMDLNISKGTSGGPIFTIDSGRVVAIQDAGLFESSQSSQTPYAIAIKTNQVIPLLDSLRISYDRR